MSSRSIVRSIFHLWRSKFYQIFWLNRFRLQLCVM